MKGVLVGCDENQEWLLSWWWENYSAHNSFPVAFVDFGMSEKGRSWCEGRGQLISLDTLAPLKSVSQQKKEEWTALFGDALLSFRTAWFKKPFACLKSPFDFSCWIDLDCEVRGGISPIFETLNNGSEIALAREPENVQENLRTQAFIFQDEVLYNSGVIAFRKNAKIIQSWVQTALNENEQFLGDQNALSRMIYINQPKLQEFSPIYNWLKIQGENEKAVIIHYILSYKLEILERIQLSLFQQALQGLS